MSVTAIASSSWSARRPTVKPLTPITAWAIAKRPIRSMRSLPARECDIQAFIDRIPLRLTPPGGERAGNGPAALPRQRVEDALD